MEISENIYQTSILAQTCKIYAQSSALLLFKLLILVFKALKSSFFFILLLYLSFSSQVILFSSTTTITVSKGVLTSWFNFEHFIPNPALNEITGKTPADFTGNETNWRSKAPMRGMHLCHSHPAEFVRTGTWYYLKALLLVFHVTHHFVFVLQNCKQSFFTICK